MGITENYLQVLSNSLDKKIVILDQLAKLTESQKLIAQADDFDDEAFQKTLDEKSELIENLEKLDSGFQTLYDKIKAQIEVDKDRYKKEIAELQTKIKEILDRSASLQVAEQKNRNIICKRFSELKKEVHQVKKARDTAANYYKTMNNITTEPYFMDQKK